MHLNDQQDSAAALRRSLVISGLGAGLIFGTAAALHGPSLPIHAARFGLSLPEAGLIVSLHWFGACTAVFALILGLRMGARMALGLIASGACLIALGVNWPVTLLGAILIGCGQGLSSAIFNSRFLAEFGARGPSFLGLSNAFFGLGSIFGPLALVAFGSEPRAVFAIVAVISVLLWPVATPARAEPAGTGRASLPVLRGRWLLLAGSVAVALEAGLAGLGPAALMAQGVSQQGAAFYASGFFAAFLLSRLSLFWLAPLIPARRLLLGGLGGAALAAAGAALIAPGAFFVLSGACVGVLFPGYFVLSTQVLGPGTRIASMLVAAALVGGALGPTALGLGMVGLGEGAFFALVCGLSVLATVAVALCVPAPARAEDT